MKVNFTPLKLLAASLLLAQFVNAQAVGDYESTGTGNWSNTATWERWDGAAWITPAPAPTSSDGVITILNGHTVTVNVSTVADQIVVASGGILNVNVFASQLTLDDGSGTDLIVNGTLLLRAFNVISANSGSPSMEINGTMNWISGGIDVPTVINSSGLLNIGDLVNDFVRDLKSNLTNNGTINWTPLNSGLTFQDAILTNNGNFNANFTTSDRGFGDLGGTNGFVNNGTFNKLTTYRFFNTSVPFTNTGILKGLGTYDFTSGTLTNTGTISPGNSPGILNATAVALTGSPTIYLEILDGTGPGTGHDQLNFNQASVDVSNSSLIVVENTSSPIQSYTIMNNTGGVFTGNFTSVNIPLNYSITYNPGVSTSIVVTKLGSTLPAVWGDFTALVRNTKQVKLDWKTLQENNVSDYTVEHSTDGRNFTIIGTVSAVGSTNEVTPYSFIHTSPDLQKTNFYRIRQSDFDGKSAYSITRQVKFIKGILVPVTITPNPASDRLQLSVQANNIRAMLIDISGRTLKVVDLQVGNHELDISLLAPGMYQLVVFQDGKRIETKKIIKQ